MLPLVCVLLTVLLGCASLGLDLSRLYSAAVELQTAADAGALAGALALGRDPGNTTGLVDGSARELAARNAVLGTALQGDEITVQPAYRDGQGAVTPIAGWAAANAIRVTTTRQAPMLFGAALGLASSTVRRTATAWVANVTQAGCVRPLGLPFQDAWTLSGHAGGPTATGTLAAADLAALGSLSTAERTREFTGAFTASERNSDGSAPTWAPLSVGNSNSPKGYADQFDPGEAQCADQKVAAGDSRRALNGNSVERDTHDGMATLCGTTLAQCNGATGVTVRVAWVSTNAAGAKGGGGGSANDADVRLLGQVRILCYFGQPYSAPGHGNQPLPASNCPATNYQGRPAGTLVVEMLPPSTTGGVPGDTYGNTPSGMQRLFLVQ